MKSDSGKTKFLQRIFDYEKVYINEIEADGIDIAQLCKDILSDKEYISGIRMIDTAGKNKTLCLNTTV